MQVVSLCASFLLCSWNLWSWLQQCISSGQFYRHGWSQGCASCSRTPTQWWAMITSRVHNWNMPTSMLRPFQVRMMCLQDLSLQCSLFAMLLWVPSRNSRLELRWSEGMTTNSTAKHLSCSLSCVLVYPFSDKDWSAALIWAHGYHRIEHTNYAPFKVGIWLWSTLIEFAVDTSFLPLLFENSLVT